MFYLKILVVFSLSIILLMSCQSYMVKKKSPREKSVDMAITITVPDSAKVTANWENVREKPNGRILGQLRKDQLIYINKRFGNWILFHNSKFDSAFIWGPSVGFEYLNLYNPFVYFDSTRSDFHSVQSIRNILGRDGRKTDEFAGEFELFFSGLGLGSHDDIVLEVVTENTQTVQHGITIMVDTLNQEISRIKVDFFKPVKGVKAALEKCDLPDVPPSSSDQGHVIWEEGSMVNGLLIDLERKVWQSEWFSAIWFKLPE